MGTHSANLCVMRRKFLSRDHLEGELLNERYPEMILDNLVSTCRVQCQYATVVNAHHRFLKILTFLQGSYLYTHLSRTLQGDVSRVRLRQCVIP